MAVRSRTYFSLGLATVAASTDSIDKRMMPDEDMFSHRLSSDHDVLFLVAELSWFFRFLPSAVCRTNQPEDLWTNLCSSRVMHYTHHTLFLIPEGWGWRRVSVASWPVWVVRLLMCTREYYSTGSSAHYLLAPQILSYSFHWRWETLPGQTVRRHLSHHHDVWVCG